MTVPTNPVDLPERILQAAERLFREVGYHKTTVADIAASIGMSPGNIYRHFASKKAVNEAVAEGIFAQIQAQLAVIAGRRDVSATDRLRELILVLHQTSRQQFTSDRRVYEMVEVAVAESWDVIQKFADYVDDLIRALLDAGVSTGEFQIVDTRLATRCVSTAITRFCHPALIAQRASEAQPAIEQMTDFILRALGANASSARAPAKMAKKHLNNRRGTQAHDPAD